MIQTRPTGANRLVQFLTLGAISISLCACSDTPDASTSPSAAIDDDLAWLSVAELQTRFADDSLTSQTLVASLIERIERLDDAGPTLNAVIAVNPDALSIAQKLDQERAQGQTRGPLHGIPVLLKANIDTGDRVPTSAGSLALSEHIANDDARLVADLRAAGLVILGKTNLSEWANFRSTESVSGWSSVGGQTRNPHVIDRNACGSSSGSAAAVAAGFAPLAVGTETDGSIVCPSGVNGIVGIKPTLGLVSRDGIIPIAVSQDTAGPMARDVASAAALLAVLAQPDPADPAADDHPGARNYAAPAQSPTTAGKRIGIWRGYYGSDGLPRVTAIVDRTAAALRDLGADVIDPIDLTLPDGIGDAEYQVLLIEFRAGLNAYLANTTLGADRNTLDALIAWNEANAAATMPWFGQEIFIASAEAADAGSPEHQVAIANSGVAMRAALDRLFDELSLDAVIAPTNGPAWPIDSVQGDRFSLSSSRLAAVSGWPSITLPAGAVRGLPIGISIIGRRHSEPLLIGIAAELEAGSDAYRRPEFVPTLEP